MISYSERAKKAFAYLFRPYNDIDVYVEDSASRNMYEVLINRALDGEARVQRIFQQGNRHNVLTSCAADQAIDNRRRLYIIDGDFDFINGVPVPALQFLYRLGVYTSENLVFTGNAVVEIAYECLSNTERAEVERIIDFPAFRRQIVDILTPLFIAYSIAYKLRPEIQTTGFNVMNLCEQSGRYTTLSPYKVRKKTAAIIAELAVSVPPQTLRAELAEARERFRLNETERSKLLSGKTYLLPLLYHHLRTNADFAGSIENLKVRLARHCDLNLDAGLIQALQASAHA